MQDLIKRFIDLPEEKRQQLLSKLQKSGLRTSLAPEAQNAPILPIRREDYSATGLPLSFAQQRLWFIHQLEPNSAAYHTGMIMRIKGELNITVLRRSLNQIVQRHEVLRSTFQAVDGRPFLKIAAALEIPLPVVDLSALEEDAVEPCLQGLIYSESQGAFDLARGPLLRLTLLRLGPVEHVLLLIIHHIVSDGWTYTVFFRDLSAFYSANLTHQPALLPKLSIQYTDYAAWQQKGLQDKTVEDQLAYWRKQLAGELSPVGLPVDYPRVEAPTTHGAVQAIRFSPALTQNLKALSQKENATLFVTLLTIFKILLCRHTGQTDIIVGTPLAGRNRDELENLIGLFVNALALRTDLSGNPGFRELLSRVREVVLAAYANQDVSFEKLVEELQPARHLHHNPFFDVLFNFFNMPKLTLTLAGLNCEQLEIGDPESVFNMTLYVIEKEQGLDFQLVYRRDLFSAARMRAFLDQFYCLAEQVAAAPERAIGDYSLVTPTDRVLLPDPTRPLTEPKYSLTTQVFMEVVARRPQERAVIRGDQSWNYAELAECSLAIARTLRAHGLESGDVVAVYGARSFGLIAGLLGVFFSGGVLFTVDPQLPSLRKQSMFREAQVRFLLCVQTELLDAEWLESVGPLQQIGIDPQHGRAFGPVPKKNKMEIPLPAVDPDDPAYIFFTSGTTGTPKGVLGHHKGVAHFLDWQRRTFAIGPQDRFVQLIGLSFNVLLRDVFTPLISGATLYLPEEDSGDLAHLLPWLEQKKISVLHTVPSILQTWLANPLPGVSLRHLRLFFVSGEPLKGALIREWYAAFPESGEIINFYGQTESTMVKTFYRVPRRPASGIQPAGRPLPDTQVWVMGANNRMCGIFEPGEIVMRSPFITRGYINAPLEQKRFMPNPFRSDPKDIVYYSGDLGTYRPDGNLEFIGRRDFQIKIHGVRIELAEIESVLTQYPLLQGAVVLAHDSKQHPDEKQLTAYVLPREGQIPELKALRRYLQDRLPAIMIPSAFVMMPAFPLTANGKIDRRALPAPGQTMVQPITPFVAARTSIEKRLVAIWAEVLNTDQVGVYDNFYELGGHSLLAMQVIARIRRVFEIELPLRALFAEPTIAGLAGQIEAVCSARKVKALPSIPAVTREYDGATGWSKGLPLSFGQERLWFLEQMDPGGTVYIISNQMRLSGKPVMEALIAGLNAIVRRHEILRTHFSVSDGPCRQVIAPALSFDLPVTDLRDLEKAAREEEAARLAAAEAQRPFDLTRGPLLRVRLLQMDAEDYILLLVLHHIIADGWSLGVLMREWGAFYQAFLEGRSASLPELPIQYADYAVWQRQRLQGEVWDAALKYWKQKLQDAPQALELPLDHPRPAVKRYQGSSIGFDVSREVWKGLEHLAQREGVTLFMVLSAAFQVLLYRYTAQKDLVVGTPIANRDQAEVENLIGFFVNTLALRADLSGDPSFKELLTRTKETTLEAYAHQNMPFEKLVEELQPKRDLSRTPLFQVMFALHNFPWTGLELPNLKARLGETQTAISKFDLTLSMWSDGDGLQGWMEYDRDLFEPATLLRMAGHFRNLLQGILDQDAEKISALPLLSDAEKEQLLIDWNQSARDFPSDQSLPELFEEQAERFADAVAVVFEDQSLTYKELNRRATQLAHHLHRLGVRPEVLVGIRLERSLELIIGLLGILKAGGAYLPLDPSYPQERLVFMLEDSGAQILLTQSVQPSVISPQSSELKVIYLDTEWGTIQGMDGVTITEQNRDNLEVEISPENLAYASYTSGSTGVPKGVLISHRSVVRLVKETHYAELNADQIFLQLAPLMFDASTLELWGCLLNGARLVLFPERLPALEKLGETLEREGVSLLWLTAGLFHKMVEQELPRLRKVKQLLAGGDVLSVAHVRQVLETMPDGWLINGYGPTENTTFTCCYRMHNKEQVGMTVAIGRPIANTQVYVLDRRMQPVPIGVPGELYTGGDGLARGYLGCPDLTAEKFIPDPFSSDPNARMYQTGDLARWLPDGNIEFLGRRDHQVKIRGFRIELEEIEAVLRQAPDVRETVVTVREDVPSEKRLAAYVVIAKGREWSVRVLHDYLKARLPEYMVPSDFVMLEHLPLTPNGKVDRQALPIPERRGIESEKGYAAPQNEIERMIAAIWRDLLRVQTVGVNDNFFDLGGHSLLVLQMHQRLQTAFTKEITVTDLFKYPTVSALAGFMGAAAQPEESLKSKAMEPALEYSRDARRFDIAVIGMAGRFPGANNLEEFWENISQAKESITFFNDDELLTAGVDPQWLKMPDYVKAAAVIPDIDCFDAHFFGINPREAETMDPQQRLFLEQAWQILEQTGYDPEQYSGRIGVYAGMSDSAYLANNVQPYLDGNRLNSKLLQVMMGNSKDFLATQASYRLNLTGPSISIQTACSTSLVAVHTACRSLLQQECDMALAGGISLNTQATGHFYSPEGIHSPDGHCRPFAAGPHGTVGGNGVGLVLLKRLDDALKDGDAIQAIIKGSAINNDGIKKIGYTAPSEEGQTKVISAALAAARINPGSITYVEAHGTGTALGDPIEAAALTRVFRGHTPVKQFCALGSVKGNIGHLNTAAGVAGLIKTVLCLKNKQLVPSLHYTEPNPKIDFANSPFYVNTRLQGWEVPDGQPRRAGVSSFGLGGTNAHVILEEAPEDRNTDPGKAEQLILLSAKTDEALQKATAQLTVFLRQHPETNLADAAYTLQAGRQSFEHRRALVCTDLTDAVAAMETLDPDRVYTSYEKARHRPLYFMFPGQGSQYVNMGRGLYETEALFRGMADQCAEILQPHLGLDLRKILYPLPDAEEKSRKRLEQTALAQPALFVLEYSLARLWMSWGLKPEGLLGHGIGEYVAACLAEVFTLEEALVLAAQRGRLVQSLAGGAMPAPVPDEFRAHVKKVALKPPKIAFISNVTGTWITAEEAMDSGYWAKHLHQTVRFADGMAALHKEPDAIFLEVGPGNTLSTFAKQQSAPTMLSSLPQPGDQSRDRAFLLNALGRLWLCGLTIAWQSFYDTERRKRISLPTYPFERQRYWMKPRTQQTHTQLPAAPHKKPDPAEWLYAPIWKQSGRQVLADWNREKSSWLIFSDDSGLGVQMAARLKQSGQEVTMVKAGDHFRQLGKNAYIVNPGRRDDYGALFKQIGPCPSRVVHLWNVTGPEQNRAPLSALEENLDLGFFSLIFLAQAIAEQALPEANSIQIGIVSNHMQNVLGDETLCPEQATLLGACKVIPLDCPGLTCRSIDILMTNDRNRSTEDWSERLLCELTAKTPDTVVALRNRFRWVQAYEPVRWPMVREPPKLLRQGGVYLITGGLGGMGLTLARYLVRTVQAKLVLISRSALPEPEHWKTWLAAHDEQDKTSRKIRELQTLKALPSEVLILSADVSDPAQMQTAVLQARKRFGAIQGVFHFAGVAGGGVAQVKTREAALKVLMPKIKGVLVLEELFREAPLDFLVMASSLSSILGSAGQSDYAAANAFLDVFARRGTDSALHATTINWDTWRELGMAVETEVPVDLRGRREEALKHGITPQEGMEVMARILTHHPDQIVVSTQDLSVLLDLERVSGAGAFNEARQIQETRPVYARPALQNAYTPPGNEIERKLAEVWQALLGLEKVGIHDNFFELGGHSLLIVQMQSRLEDVFQRRIPVAHIFEYPTIRALVGYMNREPESDAESFAERGQKYREMLKRQRK